MKQFKTYIGRQSGKVTCINDAFGRKVAVFNGLFRPGDIVERNVEHSKKKADLTQSRFRIIRKVSDNEVEELLILANCPLPKRHGWWYEVLGD